MSRLFVAASTQRFEIDVGIVGATPLTMAAWFYSDSETASQTIMCLADKDVATTYWALAIRGDVANNPVQAQARSGGTTSSAVSTAGYTINTWGHACAVFTSSTSRAAYFNGANKGTDATSRAPTAIDRTSIGRLGDSTPSDYMSGRIAEACLWDVALTDAEVQALGTGCSPLRVRPGSLKGYWPIWGITSPEIDYSSNGSGNDLTVGGTGTPAQKDHAPTGFVFSWGSQWDGAFTAAAGGASAFPWHYYGQQLAA